MDSRSEFKVRLGSAFALPIFAFCAFSLPFLFGPMPSALFIGHEQCNQANEQ